MANVEGGSFVVGLREMQRALKRADHELEPELKRRLRAAGEKYIAPAARSNAPKRSGRLARGVKVGVTQRGASVYNTAVYGGVQNYGGKVGRYHATVLRRDKVSQYMKDAVEDTREPVAREVQGVLDWLTQELER